MMTKLERVVGSAICVMLLLSARMGLAADDEPEVVSEIVDVQWWVLTSNPPHLLVSAKGRVHKGGYSNAKLTRVHYTLPPSDGIQDYVLRR
jgi:hypothetical protein